MDFDADGKLQSIEIRSGATTAEGVSPTATEAEVKQAYENKNGFTVTRDERTKEVFGVVLVKAAKGDASYTFVFQEDANRATAVAVPGPAFCD